MSNATAYQTDRISGLVGSIAIKAPVRVATTGNITLVGVQTIDGVLVEATVGSTPGDRVLVKNQTDATQNGIYLVQGGAWSREPDFDGIYDIAQGTVVIVAQGSAQARSLWQLTSTPPLQIGTTALNFSNIASTGIDVTSSLTNLTITTGTRMLTVGAGMAYQPGIYLSIASTVNPLNYMWGVVTSYNAATGVLVLNALASNGTGAASSWVVGPSGPPGPGSTVSATPGRLTGMRILSASDTGAITGLKFRVNGRYRGSTATFTVSNFDVTVANTAGLKQYIVGDDAGNVSVTTSNPGLNTVPVLLATVTPPGYSATGVAIQAATGGGWVLYDVFSVTVPDGATPTFQVMSVDGGGHPTSVQIVSNGNFAGTGMTLSPPGNPQTAHASDAGGTLTVNVTWSLQATSHWSWLTLYPPVDNPAAAARKIAFDSGAYNLPGHDYAPGLKHLSDYKSAQMIDLATFQAPPSPTLTLTSGGSLADGTVYVQTTFQLASGQESFASPQASIDKLINDIVNVGSPSADSQITGYFVYAGSSSTSLTKQNAVATAIGTTWHEPTTGLITTDRFVPPLQPATGLPYWTGSTANRLKFDNSNNFKVPLSNVRLNNVSLIKGEMLYSNDYGNDISLRGVFVDVQSKGATGVVGVFSAVSLGGTAPGLKTGWYFEDFYLTNSFAELSSGTVNAFVEPMGIIRRGTIDNLCFGVQYPFGCTIEDVLIKNIGPSSGPGINPGGGSARDHGNGIFDGYGATPVVTDVNGFIGHNRYTRLGLVAAAPFTPSYVGGGTTALWSIQTSNGTFGYTNGIMEGSYLDGGTVPIVINTTSDTPVKNVIIRNCFFTRNYGFNGNAGGSFLNFRVDGSLPGGVQSVYVYNCFWADTGELIDGMTGTWSMDNTGVPHNSGTLPALDPVNGDPIYSLAA